MSESLHVGLSIDLKKAVSKIFPNHTTLVGNDVKFEKNIGLVILDYILQ